jgi:hypothetical protein
MATSQTKKPKSQTRKPSQAKKRSTTKSSNGRASSTRSSNGGSSSSDKLSELASKAKLPLIVGGAAVAGAVGGVARTRAKAKSGPVEALKRVSSSLPTPSINPRKLDLDKVKSAGERLSSIGQQTVDVANAVEKTRKKNK